MEQYISKSDVVAEIEKRKRKLLDHIICESDKEWVVRTAHQLNRIIMFIDNLEVKEVDLDFTKEVDMWIENNEDTNGFFNVQDLAKHFFELGMAVSNKAQKGK